MSFPIRRWFFSVALPLAMWTSALQTDSCAQDAPDRKPVAPFALADGDRVVLLGSTFIESDQTQGYLEAALTSRFHTQKIEFRNLGWSGDNVFGEARARFGTVADGFEHLKQHVLTLKPTVIILSYGATESFAGPAGLESFLAGLEVLLKTLDETHARIVFLSPLRHEDLGRPLPDPTEHNQQLKLYVEATADVAGKRQAPFVNLYKLLGEKLQPPAGAPLTDNGLHLTAYGYWRATPVIERALGLPPRRWQVEIDAKNKNVSASGTTLSQLQVLPTGLAFHALDQQLPLAPAPPGSPQTTGSLGLRVFRVTGLPAGKYTLKIDGQEVGTADAQQWAGNAGLGAGPDFEQVELLRKTIVAKNRLYFHRWRPQNETYLFGFRKHEQGQNAVEIPQFDPLIAAQEATIHQLCAPVARAYQLTKVDAK